MFHAAACRFLIQGLAEDLEPRCRQGRGVGGLVGLVKAVLAGLGIVDRPHPGLMPIIRETCFDGIQSDIEPMFTLRGYVHQSAGKQLLPLRAEVFFDAPSVLAG
jgi:hypothetical protein